MYYSVFEPTPIIAVDCLRPFIEGKVVYDIGSGNGEFARAMAQYAKKVVGVEIDSSLVSVRREIEFINNDFMREIEFINNDFMNVDLSEAEVIYAYLSFIGNYALTRKLVDGWQGTVISLLYPLHNSLTEIMKPDEIIHFREGDVAVPFLIYRL